MLWDVQAPLLGAAPGRCHCRLSGPTAHCSGLSFVPAAPTVAFPATRCCITNARSSRPCSRNALSHWQHNFAGLEPHTHKLAKNSYLQIDMATGHKLDTMLDGCVTCSSTQQQRTYRVHADPEFIW